MSTLFNPPRALQPDEPGFLSPPKIEARGDGDLIEALEALKPLIAQYGVDKVKRLVEVLG
jgi:hypothetical protein